MTRFEAKRLGNDEADALRQEMKAAGLKFISADTKAEENLALGAAIPEDLEDALSEAQQGMKKEIKAFAVLISGNPRENHREDCLHDLPLRVRDVSILESII